MATKYIFCYKDDGYSLGLQEIIVTFSATKQLIINMFLF